MAIQVSRPADVVAPTDARPIPGLGSAGQCLPPTSRAAAARPQRPAHVPAGFPGPSSSQPTRGGSIRCTDGDHSGSLMEILGAAPNAHLITKSLGLGIRPVWYVIRSVSYCMEET
jgi:hypothetical protein